MTFTILELQAVMAVFGPLLGAGSYFLNNRKLVQIVPCLCIGLAACMSLFIIHNVCFGDALINLKLLSWLKVGDFSISWGIMIDPLAAIMMGVVTCVSLMVHIYSLGYMHDDLSIGRFMSYLSLFTFLMLMLVVSPNLLQLFFGWEGVGLASYLLIGFWHERESANAASMKAFLVNRVADIFLALGICATFVTFDSVEFCRILSTKPGLEFFDLPFIGQISSLSFIGFCLFIGAMGKSAQLGLHVWLPDAMEGPTPVSALIHAATMVTAGIFLMVRLSLFWESTPELLDVILVVGSCTAFFAATVACTQTDIKRVIAYSTCSQLGLMFASIGVGAYGLAIFHLMTHAFFKALLFLGAGSVIHALGGEQDLRSMGGVAKYIPYTCAAMWLGSIALAGIPFFSGYYSKDAIMESLWAGSSSIWPFQMCLFAALLTAFYSWRLLILAFHGKARSDSHVLEHAHEAPPNMLIPLIVLGVGSILVGFLTNHLFVTTQSILGPGVSALTHDLLEGMHHVPLGVKLSPLIVAILGMGLSGIFYGVFPQIPSMLQKNLGAVYRFFLNKWYFDALYEAVFVRPLWYLGKFLWTHGDGTFINGFGPDGVAALVKKQALYIKGFQTGYLYHYALAMLMGVSIFLTLFLFWL